MFFEVLYVGAMSQLTEEDTMKTIIFASLVAIVSATSINAASAASGQFEDKGMSTIIVHKHRMQIHEMVMADGTTVYGLTRAQLQQMNVRWAKEAHSTDGSGR